jgi:hypothetical protein
MKTLILDTNACNPYTAGESADIVSMSIFALGELLHGFKWGVREKEKRHPDPPPPACDCGIPWGDAPCPPPHPRTQAALTGTTGIDYVGKSLCTPHPGEGND